jgi:hypothetical protein
MHFDQGGHMRIKSLTLALAVAAFAAPAAQAHHAPAWHAPASPSSASTWTASGREVDRLGPKYVTLQHAIAPPVATPVAKVVQPAAFNWDDAAIGGGIGAVAVALIAVLTVFLTRRTRRAALPERSELAGA